ncbi:TRAP-type C4-dicarboxylate transport system, small permease component [Nitratireductor aquibiodomus]|uniref:TRAP transporter small permease protein n=1 Tax=Nitratireductor aquibiodomus TaxID=204799 RepID=A0A1H4LSK7_9HYPH|nr:TRAP transporter small permease [Nitratireductor aquibiodomus]SEB73739.1 TRAP-type C4-dicarboxylate transport system, small permease component [Nitratireductor aquibiodomus]
MRQCILWLDNRVREIEHHALWLLLATIFVILTATVFFRYVLGSPITWTEELLTMLFTWMVFIGASAALSTHQHIRIDMVLRILPPRYELLASVVAVLVCLVVFLVVIHFGLKYVRTTWGDRTPMMDVTYGFYTLALPVTSMCATLHIIRNCVEGGVRDALKSTIEVQAGEGDAA